METDGMGSDRAIYSPDIVVSKRYLCDFISCYIPNLKVAAMEWQLNKLMNADVLEKRINYMFSVVADRGVVALIITVPDAVYGQNPETIARIYKKALSGKFKHSFGHIIMAVKEKDNYVVFKKVFEGE